MIKWLKAFRIKRQKAKVDWLSDVVEDLRMVAMYSNETAEIDAYECVEVQLHNEKVKLREMEKGNG